MCHPTTSLICRSLPWNRARTRDHAPSLDGQQFSRLRVIAVRAFWPSGLHSDCEGRGDI
jgi:hypothetical protein